ncbi:MAG: RNA methyltransferase [Agathobacter sp.]|nr:RNA methyltransferase [Agathobacter sp.]
MITSSDNKQIKSLSALIKKSKERRKQRLFVTEGPKMSFEAPPEWVNQIYVSESFYKDENNAKKLEQYEDKLWVVKDSVFNAVSDTQTPQGVMALVKMPEYDLSELINADKAHLLILESIQDPGNLGTMIRTGEGAGITGIIMNKTTVDVFNPKTVRSTMGSLYRVPFVIVEDLKGTLEELKSKGISLYAAHLKGQLSYDEPDYTTSCGFLIGNEGNGLSDEIADCADTYIKIPMEGKVESLNAAISATLLMYECNRQRRK